MTSLADTEAPPDWTGPLTASGNLRRRAAVSKAIELGAVAAAIVAVGMLIVVVEGVIQRGAGALSFGFVVHNAAGVSGAGGIANALLGTGELVAFAGLLAIPVGVLTGLYLTEFAGASSRSGRALKLALDLMQGLPTIVVALFIFGLIVIPQGKESGYAASVALAIVDAAIDRTLESGGPAARTRKPPRGGRRARRRTLAHRAWGDPADRDGGHRNRLDPGTCTGRRRDGAGADLEQPL